MNDTSLATENFDLVRQVHAGILYRTFIKQILIYCEAKTYLEIGTSTGESLADISCEAIAIDPQFNIKTNVIGNKKALHFYQETSDLFFRTRSPTHILGRSLDVAFLDGMHQFEFLLRDFINTERHCARDSIIFMHDCLPVNAEMTSRVNAPTPKIDAQYANWWTGDVWKVLPILRKWRPDLKIVCLDCPPTGLVAITNLDPSSTVLAEQYRSAVDEFIDAPFGDDDLRSFYRSNPIVDSKLTVKLEGFGRYFSPALN